MQIAALIGSIATISTMIQMESNTDIVFKYNGTAQYFWLDITYGKGIPREEHSAWLDEGEETSKQRLQAIINRLSEIYQGIKKEVA